MAESLTLDKLESYLWESANILRGSIDSPNYKNYIFGLLFLKRISDVFYENREKIRKEQNMTNKIPYFDPLDGGIKARCLCVLQEPGSGAINSGFVSRNNPDKTAENIFNYFKKAGISRKELK